MFAFVAAFAGSLRNAIAVGDGGRDAGVVADREEGLEREGGGVEVAVGGGGAPAGGAGLVDA